VYLELDGGQWPTFLEHYMDRVAVTWKVADTNEEQWHFMCRVHIDDDLSIYWVIGEDRL